MFLERLGATPEGVPPLEQGRPGQRWVYLPVMAFQWLRNLFAPPPPPKIQRNSLSLAKPQLTKRFLKYSAGFARQGSADLSFGC